MKVIIKLKYFKTCYYMKAGGRQVNSQMQQKTKIDTDGNKIY